MDLFEAIKKRRSIRTFLDEPVAREDILKMLEAARLAPSATNDQPWRFIVVQDRELIQSMGRMTHAMLDARIEAATSQERKEAMERFRFTNTHFERAPAIVVVLARPWPSYRTDYERSLHDPGLQSVAAATTHLILAATALGYASCWLTGPVEAAKDELEAMLGVESPWYMVAVVALGKTDRQYEPRPRRPLEEIVTFYP
ncbi:MAG: nitroreductase family protein [Chloroflexi bacterium]|nr:nitroreductase family protein [Chloroflexota bacterium]